MRSWIVRATLALVLCVAVVALVPGLRWRARWYLSRIDPYAIAQKLGMKADNSGSGTPMTIGFDRSDAHYQALEANRASQHPPENAAASASPSTVDASATAEVARPATPEPAPAPTSTSTTSREPAVEPTAPPAKAAAAPVSETPRTPPAARGSRYWANFRGPNRDGHYAERAVRSTWPAEGLEPKWKQPVGGGYASFTIADGRAFTIEQRRKQEVVAAYDIETGRELWTNSWDAEFNEVMGGNGPRATPTWHDGLVYAQGAEGELRCLDAATGRVIWRHHIIAENGADTPTYGVTGAPLIVDEKVIVLPGGKGGRSIIAYHRLTGERIWSSLDDPQAYASAMVVTLAGQRQLVVVSQLRAMGVTVEDGRLLWEFPWVTDFGISVAQPLLLGDDRVFLSAGYAHGAAVLQITRSGDEFHVEPVWQNNRMKNKFTSSVLHDGYIYGLDEAILTCLDAATGEVKWKGGRYGYGQIVLAGDRIIVLTETGDLVLVNATPERHEELARFKALEGKTWNHPAISDGILFVRNRMEMAAFDIRAVETSTQE